MTGLRRAIDRDSDFLLQVFLDGRIGMYAGLDPDFRETLLLQQAALQEAQYDERFPHLERYIIERSGRAIGRLYLVEEGAELILVDIEILPSEQQQGAGTQLLKAMQRNVVAEGRAIRLHVLAGGAAHRWYSQNGFEEIARREPYIEMVFNAG